MNLPNLQRYTTYTTRLPRSGENSGQDYFFVDQKEFKAVPVKYCCENLGRVHDLDKTQWGKDTEPGENNRSEELSYPGSATPLNQKKPAQNNDRNGNHRGLE